MAYWLHSTLGPAQLHENEEQARAALRQLVDTLKKRGYRVEEDNIDHARLVHTTQGFVEAYIDTERAEVGGDDET